jgi:hypothetical protein
MSERTDKILLLATEAKLCEINPPSLQLDIDTSCPHVPFGFIRVSQAKVSSSDEADLFWANCVSGDQFVDLAGASVEEKSTFSILSIVDVAKTDISRVGADQTIEFPKNIDECFIVENGCDYCCGRILLIKAESHAFYIHWHRES